MLRPMETMLAPPPAESPQLSRITATDTDSSPSSAESSFRQIDDVFLQTQTRIWLGEVLQIRLSEELIIADLLADGELLYEVSREIRKMMLTKRMELKCIQSNDCELFASRNSGRYMPYSNVDSFLKICQILGLSGIDLFSPSDVVEKKDTRKVCMCIRALSKKARSRHLNVPDFDIVMHSVAMPTDMVGYIRRSWEVSHCDYTSFTPSPHPKLRQRLNQKHSSATSGGCDSYFEESDDTESNFVIQSDNSATTCSHDICSQISYNSIDSPEVSSEVKFDVKNQVRDECIQCQQEAVHLNKITRSLFSHQLEYGQHQDNMPSSPFVDSQIHFGGRVFNADCGARNSNKLIIPEQIYNDANMEDETSVVGDTCECCSSKRNISGDQPVISALIVHETFPGESILLDGKDTDFNTCVCEGSCCTKGNRTPKMEFQSRYLHGDVSVSPVACTASVRSMSDALQNLDYDDPLVTGNSCENVLFPEPENSKMGGLSKKQTRGFKSHNMVENEAGKESQLDRKDEDIGFSPPENFLAYSDVYAGPFPGQTDFPQWDQKGKSGISVVKGGGNGSGASSGTPSLLDSHQNLQPIQAKVTGNDPCQHNMESIIADTDVQGVIMVKSETAGRQMDEYSSVAGSDDITLEEPADFNNTSNVSSGNVNENEGKDENLNKSAVENSDGTNSPRIIIAEKKPQKTPILRSVAQGSAVVGAMLLFLHYRKNGRKESGWSEKQSNQTRNVNVGKLSSAEEQKGQRGHSVYPAEKLKL